MLDEYINLFQGTLKIKIRTYVIHIVNGSYPKINIVRFLVKIASFTTNTAK